jgi:hypothetical protein
MQIGVLQSIFIKLDLLGVLLAIGVLEDYLLSCKKKNTIVFKLLELRRESLF